MATGKKVDKNVAPEKPEEQVEIIESLIGSLKKCQIIVIAFVFLTKFPMAWHMIGSGITLPGIQPVYCINTTHEHETGLTPALVKEMHKEACDPSCPEIIVGNNFWNRSIIGDYKLYCDRLIYRMVTQLLVMAGVFLGNFVFGWFSDRYGRKHLLIIGLVGQTPLGIWVAFSPNLESFLIAKFVLCIFVGGTMVTGFVLMSEIAGKKYRAYCGILYHIPFAVGHLSISGVAYILWMDWRYFQLALSIPTVLFLIGYWVLPESPRWLLAVGKVEESIKTAELIAKTNKMPTEFIRESILAEAERRKSANVQMKKGHFKDLFKTGLMAYITIALYVNWLGITCGFYGIAQLASAFTASFYLNNILAAVMQIPGPVMLCFAINILGRKWAHLIGTSVGAAACFAVAFTPVEHKIIPASIAMFAFGWTFPSIYILSGELFPTIIRSIGVGSSSSVGRIGGMASPGFEYLKQISLAIPPLIFAALLTCASIVTIFLPETKGKDLPNTVEDLDKLKRKKKSEPEAEPEPPKKK